MSESSPIDIVNTFVSEAEKYGLVSEVVYSALQYMKDNPHRTIEDAINYGYWEWCVNEKNTGINNYIYGNYEYDRPYGC